jgi:L-ascorbate metabolism protein UlaG (beta-lactamase superfamily)
MEPWYAWQAPAASNLLKQYGAIYKTHGEALFLRKPNPGLFYPSSSSDLDHWRLRYHGTAGFTLASEQTTVVIDPFVSRPGLLATGFQRLKPNLSRIESAFPRADAVLVGHAHHDHIMDAPHVAAHTKALFIGAADAANVARAAGLAEHQIRETHGREDITVKAATIRGIPSAHGRVYFGVTTLPGTIPEPPSWPPRVWDLKHGAVLNWHIKLGGISMVHVDSAEVIDEELDGLQADVVCLCAIGRRYRPGYVSSVVERLKPRWIVPCHWDWFFSPHGDPARLLPGVDLPGFIKEIESHGVTAVTLPFDGVFSL